MNTESLIAQLESNISAFLALFRHPDADFANWRYRPEKWCMLEIVCHLADEEVEDFRARVDHCLHKAGEVISPIDPQGWVLSRAYMHQNFEEQCARWEKERRSSVTWLKTLANADWNRMFDHPRLGQVNAWFFLSNWVEHDYLHLRQILTVRHYYLESKCSSRLFYAGEWTPNA